MVGSKDSRKKYSSSGTTKGLTPTKKIPHSVTLQPTSLVAVEFNPGPSTSANSDPCGSASLSEPPHVRKIYSTSEFENLLENSDEENLLSDYDVSSGESEMGNSSEDEEEEEDTLDTQSSSFDTQTALRQRTETDRIWTPGRPNTNRHTFDKMNGINVKFEDRPVDVFKSIFNQNMIDLTVMETNSFGELLKEISFSSKSRMKNWKRLSEEEFLVWLGLLFHMGSIPLAKIKNYWSTDMLFDISLFRSCMSRDRFFSILQSLHFNKNEPHDTDRLSKIRPLLDVFHNSMNALYRPTRELCIGESMMLWRGRLVFRVYIKGKRHKYGIKLYMLTEPSGLVLRVIVYTGASDPKLGGQLHADKVVHKLMEGKLDCGHSLFTDSYYNSVNLAHHLLERKTYITGMLKANRKGNPSSVTNAKLKKNQISRMFSEEGVCVFKWHDGRDILMISSEFGADMVDSANRRGVSSHKPEAVVKYNESMGGIDRVDRIMSYYPLEKKRLKWYKKLGIHIFHLTLINSFFLYQKSFPNTKISLEDYRLSVIRSLIFPSYKYKMIKNPSITSRRRKEHVPRRYDIEEGHKRVLRRRCRECASMKIRKDTTFYCPACPDLPPLCLRNCFAAFHKHGE